MTQPATDWKKAVRDFASDYLLPVGGLIALFIIGIGALALAGLGLMIAVPIALVLLLLLIIALLTSEVRWRIAALNSVLGIGATFYAVDSLLREPLWTILGVIVGGLLVWALYMNGDPVRVKEKSPETLTDALGQSHRVLLLSSDALNLQMIVGGLVGLALTILCLYVGAWSFFLGLYASVALGRAMSWFSVEADANVKVFWQPTAFLRGYTPFRQVFNWWHQTRRLIAIGFVHWVQER